MRIDKLFKVLVVGGSALTAGCGDNLRDPSAAGIVVSAEAGTSDVGTAAVDVAASRDVTTSRDVVTARDVAARADGVSSWMSWFVDPVEEEDAGVADVGVADAGSTSDVEADASGDVPADDGVLAWLSWV